MHNLPVEEQHPNPQKGNGQFLPREKLASESRISSDRSQQTAVFFLSGKKGPDRNFRPLKIFSKIFEIHVTFCVLDTYLSITPKKRKEIGVLNRLGAFSGRG